MSRAVEILRGDHRTFLQLLELIEREIEVFSRADRPDYTLLEAILEYFKAYPGCAHHAAETLVYDRLKHRAPQLCAGIPDPCVEHQSQERQLDTLRHVVGVVLSEGEIPRDAVTFAARTFVDQVRSHLEMEESRMLPAALEHLREADWAEIDAQFGERRDQALNSRAVAELDDLKATILRWCAERGEKEMRAAS